LNVFRLGETRSVIVAQPTQRQSLPFSQGPNSASQAFDGLELNVTQRAALAVEQQDVFFVCLAFFKWLHRHRQSLERWYVRPDIALLDTVENDGLRRRNRACVAIHHTADTRQKRGGSEQGSSVCRAAGLDAPPMPRRFLDMRGTA
jgi:hypothetical protein